MVHAYHLIIPMYGFWLPNDPRGSWSEVIRKWELLMFGDVVRTMDRQSLGELTPAEREQRRLAKATLDFPPVSITGLQAAGISRGFGLQIAKSQYTVWACSILPEHTHLVIARHRYAIEQIANLLKGASTAQLIVEGQHPLAHFAGPNERPPRMWAARRWKVFLDSEEAIENAIRYVEDNPVKEGKPKQNWPFVIPFRGLPQSGIVTYD